MSGGGGGKEIKRVVKCLTLPNKTQYTLSKLAIRCDPEDIRRSKCGFENGYTKKRGIDLIQNLWYDTEMQIRKWTEQILFITVSYLTSHDNKQENK